MKKTHDPTNFESMNATINARARDTGAVPFAPSRRISSETPAAQRRRESRWAPFLMVGGLALVVAMIAGCAKGLDKTTNPPNLRHIGATGGSPPSFIGNPAGATSPPAIPGALPSPHEELWIIAQSRSISNSAERQSRRREANSGALCVKEDNVLVPMPLKHTDVRADLAGYIASVRVVQQFQNPYSNTIEAVYVFPLPENAAVNEFVMTIGERRIRGIIRERAEAEEIYQAAKRQGHVASLLTQERPNIFTQSVANLEPGRLVDVAIQYFHTLAYDNGWYEFVFPMVVGPRYNPTGITNGIGAIARGNRGATGQATEISYLAPHERNGHNIALTVSIDAGVALEEAKCPSHQTSIVRPSGSKAIVTLNPDDSIPNKDFVLRYRVAGDRIKSNLLTHEDARGGFFTLMLYPPADLGGLNRQPLELVFVLDCSGSMNGTPLAQAKTAIDRALDRLQPGDSFQIINFSERSSALGSQPVVATPENIRRGRRYLGSLKSDGPTQMIEGIKAALDFPHDPERLRFVCFLTDGYIGNEREILAAIQGRLGASRIFSFGVGTSPNRYLMDGMARIGRGAVAYLGAEDNAPRVMDSFFDRISHPALTDVQIDWAGLKVSEVYPTRVPDLFVGRPVVLTGRYSGRPTGIRVAGQAAGRPVTIALPASDSANPVAATGRGLAGGPAALPSVWGRMKIAALSEQALVGDAGAGEALAANIKQVALDYNLMSAYTAFVAVDAARKITGGPGESVPVAVPLPAGVNYEKTINENGRKGE